MRKDDGFVNKTKREVPSVAKLVEAKNIIDRFNVCILPAVHVP
jgi:hypothetical protein